MERFPEIAKNVVADIFRVSRQWLYKREFIQEHKDAVLKEQIEALWSSSPIKASYGYRRISIELGVGKKRVRRLMHKYGLKPYKRKARWRKEEMSKESQAPYQNQIKETCPILPNHTWVGDFTYLPFKGKFLYLATFMDVFTREIVGWQISHRHDKNLVMQAFLDSLVNRDFQKPTFVHTDQGAEYTSQAYTDLVKNFGIQVSMSTKSSPWENGYQESFYNNFKTDLGLEFDRFEDTGHFLEAIHHTLYSYNHQRIHSAHKMPPSKFHACYLNSLSTKRGA